MFSKNYTEVDITPAILNSASGFVADGLLTVNFVISKGVPKNLLADPLSMYPKYIQVVNRSGADLEWLILSSDDDVAMYADPVTYPYFDFILLPNNEILENSNLPRCKQFIIRTVTGSVAKYGIRIDFTQYSRSN